MSNPAPQRWDFTLSRADMDRLAETSMDSVSEFVTDFATGTLIIPPQEFSVDLTTEQVREMIRRGELVFDAPEAVEKILREVEGGAS